MSDTIYNKVVLNQEVILDVSNDTAVESDVAQGKTFHKADGTQAVGTNTGGITPTGTVDISNNGTYDVTNYANASVNVTGGDPSQIFTQLAQKELQSVTFAENTTEIGDRTFWFQRQLSSVTMQPTITTIGNYAFNGCNSLSSIDVSNVSHFGDAAFRECYALRSLSLTNPGLTRLPDYLLQDCANICTLNLNDNITEIGEGSLRAIRVLSSITLPSALKKIGYEAMLDCSLSSITIPKGVTSIGNKAFRSQSEGGLKSVTMLPSHPPKISENELELPFENYDDLVITVPAGTISAYESAGGWSTYAGKYNEFALGTVTYTFNTTGGTPVESQTTTLLQTSPVTTSTDPSLSFIGWYDNEDLSGEAIQFPYYSTTNITLYAKYGDLTGTNEEHALVVNLGQTYNVEVTSANEEVDFPWYGMQRALFVKFTASEVRGYRFRSSAPMRGMVNNNGNLWTFDGQTDVEIFIDSMDEQIYKICFTEGTPGAITFKIEQD